MEKHKIKLIVTDIDGTLGPVSTDRINEEYYEVIRELQNRGIIFGGASGRSSYAISRLFEPVKDRMIFLADNGARAVYEGKELFSVPMNLADCRELVRDVRKLPDCQSVWQSCEKTYFEKGDEEIYHIMRDSMHYDCAMVDDLLTLTIPSTKFTIYHPVNAEKIIPEAFWEKWGKDHQLVCAGDNFMDVMDLHANKGTGLKKIQEYFGISREETMAFGDNINDMEMLENAAESYAVGEAREEVKRAARHVALPMKEDGVLQVLKTLL